MSNKTLRFFINRIIVLGTSFSGNWYGPKLFVQCVIIPGNEYVFIQALIIWSLDAFEEEYGEFGL